MSRKCHNCICCTCLNACCDRKNCKGKRKFCKDYSGFRQLSIFHELPKPQYRAAPRASWEEYGLSDKAYRKELYIMCRSKKYENLVRQAAYKANAEIAEFLIKSVMEDKSYENVEYAEELGRIPCGRTDFYGYRRLFYHLFDLDNMK